MIVLCACGCGESLEDRDSRGRARGYVFPHQSRADRGWRSTAPTRWTGYGRSKRVVRQMERCELEHIGSCLGALQRAHVDGNPLNNARENIKVLCDSHHGLYDNGKIDLANPVMPDFFVSGGERRYRPRLKPRTCRLATCARPFTSEASGSRYCSPECAKLVALEAHRAACRRYMRAKRVAL